MKCSWASVGSISSLGDFDTHQTGASQVALEVKNPPASALDITDEGWIPGPGRTPRGENDNPLQYSCLENLMEEEPDGLQSIGLHSLT